MGDSNDKKQLRTRQGSSRPLPSIHTKCISVGTQVQLGTTAALRCPTELRSHRTVTEWLLHMRTKRRFVYLKNQSTDFLNFFKKKLLKNIPRGAARLALQ